MIGSLYLHNNSNMCQGAHYKNCMNSIQIFNNEQFGQIRIAMNESNEPLFCLADVCKILDLRVDGVLPRLNQNGYNRIGVTDSMGRNQNAYFVNEKNLYRVIMRSDKEEAVVFQDWICDEVLPSIRKHGAYMTSETLEKALTSPDFLIQLATTLKEEKQKRIEAEQANLKNAPKVLFSDAMVAAENSILIGRLATVLKQNGVDIGQNRLFKWMRNNGYLCKSGEQYNQPTQSAMELGIFEVSYKTVVQADKSIQTITTKVTGKGQMYFVNKFLA